MPYLIIYIRKRETDRSDEHLIPSKASTLKNVMKPLLNLCFPNVSSSITYPQGTVHFCRPITASKAVIEQFSGAAS